MPLCLDADSPTFERHDFTFRSLAVPSRGSTELATWWLDIALGASSEPHEMDREEVFVVVSGTITAQVGDEEVTARAGDAVIVPPHTRLQIRNSCEVNPAKVIAITSAGMKARVGDQTIAPPWAQ